MQIILTAVLEKSHRVLLPLMGHGLYSGKEGTAFFTSVIVGNLLCWIFTDVVKERKLFSRLYEELATCEKRSIVEYERKALCAKNPTSVKSQFVSPSPHQTSAVTCNTCGTDYEVDTPFGQKLGLFHTVVHI